MTENRAYLLPANVDPDNDVCIRVYVPDATEYIAAFWGAYEYFTKWLAWERDTDHRGRLAAARWLEALNKTREANECLEGTCGIMDIRQKPDVPCIIQKQTDCTTWEDEIDMRLCVPRMRIYRGVVQQDTTGQGDWQDAGDPDDPYDPREDAPAPAPWPTPPSGEDAECLSAANVAAYVNFVAASFADAMVDGLTFFQTLGVATTILSALMDIIPLTVLTAGITSLYQTVIDDWVDVRDFDITSKLTELMACRYSNDGSMSSAAFTELIQDVTDWRATLSDNDQRAKWQIAITTMQLWGPVGMTVSGQIWGITTYDCAYSECAYDITYDFTSQDWGFVCNEDSGEWRTGCLADYEADGWHSVTRQNGGVNLEIVQIWKETGKYNLTYFEVNYTVTGSNISGGIAGWYGDGHEGADKHYLPAGTWAPGTYTKLWTGNVNYTQIGVDSESANANVTDIRINWIRIKGGH